MGGYAVLVNETCLGYISEERGFFTAPTVVQCFMEVSIKDFQAIQEKISEVVHPQGHALAMAHGERKARTLMIVIQKMIAAYQNSHAGNLNESIFVLFEKAKRVRYAADPTSLTEVIEDI
jgi:hypothetical protein